MSNKRRPLSDPSEHLLSDEGSFDDSSLSDLDGLFVDDDVAMPKNGNKAAQEAGFDADDAAKETELQLHNGKSSAVPRSKTAKRKKKKPRPPSDRSFAFAAGVLTCVKGPEQGLALKLIEGSYTIGRGRDNHFVLKDIAASRQHIRVIVEDNEIRVVDLGSGNGTKVNGKRVKKAVLHHGDRIRIGKSVLEFTFVGDDKSRDALPSLRASLSSTPAEEGVLDKAEELAKELEGRLARHDDDDDLDLDMEFSEAVGDMLQEATGAEVPLLAADDLWQETQTAHAGMSDGSSMPPPLADSDTPPSVDQPPPLVPASEQSPSTAKRQSPLLLVALFMSVVLGVAIGGFGLWWVLRDDGDPPADKQSASQDAKQVAKNDPKGKSSDDDKADAKAKEAAAAKAAADAKAKQAADKKAQKKKASLLKAAKTALAAGDLTAAQSWAEKALNTVPGDPEAVAVITDVQKARSTREAQQKEEQKKAAQQKAADDRRAQEAADKAARERAAQEAEAKARAAQAAKERKAAQRRARQRARDKAAREKAARQKAAREKAKRNAKMSDDEAKRLFKKAIGQFRDGNESKGCATMRTIAKKAPATSTWGKKADSFRSRKCR